MNNAGGEPPGTGEGRGLHLGQRARTGTQVASSLQVGRQQGDFDSDLMVLFGVVAATRLFLFPLPVSV